MVLIRYRGQEPDRISHPAESHATNDCATPVCGDDHHTRRVLEDGMIDLVEDWKFKEPA